MKRWQKIGIYTAVFLFAFGIGFGLFDIFTANCQLIDTTQRFDHAMIKLADGEIVEGRVDSWRDYENSDQIQVTINGTTYLIHSMNVTLIKN